MPLRFLTAGESHGPELSVILEGIPAGLRLDVAQIDHELSRRQKGHGRSARMKIEKDRVRVSGGVLGGRTTGGPLALAIPNLDHANWEGRAIPPMTIPRPGHVDLAAAIKYGYRDLRPGLERASARETAGRVALGAVCRQLLGHFGIGVGSYVVRLGSIAWTPTKGADHARLSEAAEQRGLGTRCPDPETARRMVDAIDAARARRETLGGVVQAAVWGVPAGLGSHVHWDRKLDGRLAQAVLSVPAIKGLEIGDAFSNAGRDGSEVSDPIRLGPDGTLLREGNRAGGIEGGISNGEAIVLRAAMKPIATTLRPQPSVDLASGEEDEHRYERSDVCALPRACVVVEAMVAFVIADALLEKLGGDSLSEIEPRVQALRKARLEDLPMDGVAWRFDGEPKL